MAAREAWILDGVELVPAHVFFARKAARTARVRTGSPTVIGDWTEPVHAPVGDGYTLTSRRDQREMCAREGVRECGDAGLERAQPRPYQPVSSEARKRTMNQLLHGHRPVSERTKAVLRAANGS